MRTAAVIIGIDAYATSPLTSCVNDALAFRSTLLELGLVGSADITLLTSPRVPGSTGEADGDSIRAALFEYYDRGEDVDRLYVYFAGHGMSGVKPGSVQSLRDLIVPSDVTDFENQGHKMIDLDELRGYLRLVGPREQHYFIDACRNLRYGRRPAIGSLGWSDRPPGATRSQSTLYAVAQLGEAVGSSGGHGFLTENLVAALRGAGSALDYDPATDRYVVTPESVRNYVVRRIKPLIDADPEGMAGVTVPQLDPPDPRPEPLLVVDVPEEVELVVHVHPESAAPATTVRLFYARNPYGDAQWPPRANHSAARVAPLCYALEASSGAGDVDPRRRVIDVREEREATVHVVPRGAVPASAPAAELGPTPARVEVRAAFPPPHLAAEARDAGYGVLEAVAHESVVAVDVTQQEPPYHVWSDRGRLHERLPVGPYRVTFRLGDDIFSAHEVYITEEETTNVAARVTPSSLMRDVLGVPTVAMDDAVISESIGPIQAGMVETMLPIIGIKPFDVHEEVFTQFTDLVPDRIDPHELGSCALSVVVGIDGEALPLEAVLAGLRLTTTGPGHPPEPLELRVRHSPHGPGRIATSVTAAVPGGFGLALTAPWLGELSVRSAALPNRATVVCFHVAPSGQVMTAQSILRFPSRMYPEERHAHLPYGQVLRDVELGIRLYTNGELIEAGGSDVLRSLLLAEWSDPILGCMGVFAHLDAPQDDPGYAYGVTLAQQAARMLLDHFPTLPDAHVAVGATTPEWRDEAFGFLLDQQELPVLARASQELAAYADVNGRRGTPVQEAVRRLPDRQPWTIAHQAPAASG